MEKNETTYNQKAKEHTNNTRNDVFNDLIVEIQNVKIKSYISNRLMPQMEWYSRKGRECKKRYHCWMTATIIIGALIPVVSVFADGSIAIKALLAALGSIVTACNAYITMHNFKDLWLTYRNLREKLLYMLYCYFYDTGVFANSTQEVKDVLLVSICEEEMSGEASEWKYLMQK